MKHNMFFTALFLSIVLLTSCAAPAAPTATPTIETTIAPTEDPLAIVDAFFLHTTTMMRPWQFPT